MPPYAAQRHCRNICTRGGGGYRATLQSMAFGGIARVLQRLCKRVAGDNHFRFFRAHAVARTRRIFKGDFDFGEVAEDFAANIRAVAGQQPLAFERVEL